jgi:hypothetical protein
MQAVAVIKLGICNDCLSFLTTANCPREKRVKDLAQPTLVRNYGSYLRILIALDFHLEFVRDTFHGRARFVQGVA